MIDYDIKGIIVEAGKILLDKYDEPRDVQVKDDESLVTEVDRISSDFINSRLRKLNPNYAILDEERKEDGSRFEKEFCWVVDPLDGTREYIEGQRDFGVMIGLLHNFIPVFGMCYKPLAGELSWGIKGEGAYLILNGGFREKIQVSNKRNLDRVLITRSRRGQDMEEILSKLNPTEVIPMGGSLKTIEVAKGNAELFVCTPSSVMHLWDLCAPQIILEEAGGVMTDFKGNRFDYSQQGTANGNGVIASNRLCYDNTFKLIKT